MVLPLLVHSNKIIRSHARMIAAPAPLCLYVEDQPLLGLHAALSPVIRRHALFPRILNLLRLPGPLQLCCVTATLGPLRVPARLHAVPCSLHVLQPVVGEHAAWPHAPSAGRGASDRRTKSFMLEVLVHSSDWELVFRVAPGHPRRDACRFRAMRQVGSARARPLAFSPIVRQPRRLRQLFLERAIFIARVFQVSGQAGTGPLSPCPQRPHPHHFTLLLILKILNLS